MICVSVAAILTLSSLVSAFYLTHHIHHKSYERRIDLPILYMFRKPKGGYSSMPPRVSNSSISTPSSSGNNIFKRFKRDVYPTVDLPYENNNYTYLY